VNLPLADIYQPPPWTAAWDASNVAVVTGTPANGTYDPVNHDEAWQQPRQWLLDQNNNVHRVLSRTPQTGSDDAIIELVRPVSVVPGLATEFIDRSAGVLVGTENIVTNIWYIPIEAYLDTDGDLNPDNVPVQLTPVYVTVKEL
jgi:hypothetical protein